jgi:hypothetical protein
VSETYLKCSCRACGGHIEFPGHAVGMSVGCPHCGATTDLHHEAALPAIPPTLAPPPPPPPRPQIQSSHTPAAPQARPPTSSAPSRLQVAAPPPPPPAAISNYSQEVSVPGAGAVAKGPVNWMGWGLAVASILIFVVGGAMYLNNVKQGKSAISNVSSSRNTSKSRAVKPVVEKEDETPPAASAKPAKVSKSIDDLKVSSITLQKRSGSSSLVYAMGTVRNESDVQRFGVRVELDLYDAAGTQIQLKGKPAKATDYVQVIEPNGQWRFRALVVAPKTASAKVAKVTEEQ